MFATWPKRSEHPMGMKLAHTERLMTKVTDMNERRCLLYFLKGGTVGKITYLSLKPLLKMTTFKISCYEYASIQYYWQNRRYGVVGIG